MSLKQCCATGSLHTGIPTGRIEKNVHGLECYMAGPEPSASKGFIVIVPDAFGWKFPNNRILADEFAKKSGYTVYLPEFMDGAELPEGILLSMKAFSATGLWNQLYKSVHAAYLLYHFPYWLYRVRAAVTKPRIYGWIKQLKANEAANKPIGVAGYCWGGQHVTELCSDTIKTDDGKRLVECGFTAHPSFLSYPGDIEKIVLPYSVAAAEHDQQMSPEAAKQTKEILEKKTAEGRSKGVEHEFVMYMGAHHGFGVRADEEDKEEAERGKKAEEQALKWFKKWFESPAPASVSA